MRMSFPAWNVNQYAARLICMARARMQHGVCASDIGICS